ncbi:MAG: PepSY domain-containing protein [Eggerthellaceae bacterium]|nr:PepSY domain-containing protein [Eggerthellaceae bacterium]
MRNVLTIAMAACLVLCLGACSSKADSQGSSAAEKSGASVSSSLGTDQTDSDGKLDSREIMHAAFDASPVSSRQARNILVKLEHDGVRDVTFDTDLGEFRYTVDVYTGEVVDRDEPEFTEEDLASIRIISSKEARDAVFAVCPISSREAKRMTISQKHSTWVVTFNSDYGYFSYTVDGKTGEILDKDEPEVFNNN